MTSTVQLSLTDQIFQGLRHKSAEARLQSAQDLRRYVIHSLLWFDTRAYNLFRCQRL